MRKTFLRLGSLMALAAVAIGAFGSHGLKSMLSPEQLNTYEIGVRYQFYHAFAILAVGVLLYFRKTSLLPWAGWFFTGRYRFVLRLTLFPGHPRSVPVIDGLAGAGNPNRWHLLHIGLGPAVGLYLSGEPEIIPQQEPGGAGTNPLTMFCVPL